MWQSADIAQSTGGRQTGKAFAATSVVIDSRKITPGALFVPLKGTRADGHDYVRDALAQGAAGALVHRIPSGTAKDAPLVLVNDTNKALIDLAVAARKRTSAQVIAVTGSVGKTGTKEALRMALRGSGSVYATQGNLNNHIGLPLSLANLEAEAGFGVFELGMNHAGELSFLTRIARPDIAVITNVEAVHLEFFTGIEAIADAKAEIMEGMDASGTVVLNRDNRFFDRLKTKAQAQGIRTVVTFGEHEESDCRLVNYALQEMGSHVEAVIHGTPVIYRLGTIGRHWALTSLAALAAAVAAGADLADAAAALAHFHEPDGRGRLHRLTLPNGFATLIDDCYNASPSSTVAAIHKSAELKAAFGQGRILAALGDMLELGAGAAELHRGLGEALLSQGIDKAYLAGPLMEYLYESLPAEMRGAYAQTSAELAPLLQAELRPGDILLIKGSRGSRMDILRDALLASSDTSRPVKESLHAL